MVHHGRTAHQRTKNKRPSIKMLLWGVQVVWMMPKDHQRRSRLESTHQFAVFAGIPPRTGELVVLTLEGAVAARTGHRLSEDQTWDIEFMSRVKGAPWDITPSLPLLRAINVSRMCTLRVDVEKYGPT